MKPQTTLDQTSESEFEQTNQTLITLIAGFIQMLNHSVSGSSCNYLYFGLILSSFLSLSFSWHRILPWGNQIIERESKV